MNREEIKNRLDKQNFNTETISLLLNAIDDIELVCGKYISIDEVVNRICELLSSNVEYDDLRKNGFLGVFSSSSKKITLDKSLEDNPELQASVFFHEVIHCITSDKENLGCGFHFVYQSFNEDEYEEEGYGFDEGITQYLTKKRNKLRGVNIELGYPILTMEVENIISLIGEDDIFNSLFHNPNTIKDVFQKHNIDYDLIIPPLDTIHDNEQIIEKQKYLSDEERLLSDIYNKKFGSRLIYEKMGFVAKLLNQELLNVLRNIDSIEDFNKAVNFIVKLKTQDYGLDTKQINDFLSINIKKLIDLGFDKNEIDNILEENELKKELEMQSKLNSLITDDKNETLLNIYTASENDTDLDFPEFIFEVPSNEMLLINYFFPKQDINSIFMCIYPLGQFIQQYPEYDFDELSLKAFSSEIFESEFFNIIHTSDGKSFIIMDENKVREITDIEEKNILTISSPLDFKVDSNLNILKNLLKERQELLEQIKSLNAPQSILDKQNQIIDYYKENIAEIKARISARRNKSKKTNHSTEDSNPTEVGRE